MFNYIKKFFHILSSFIFCLSMIRQGFNIKTGNYKVTNYKELWQYCKAWEEGNL